MISFNFINIDKHIVTFVDVGKNTHWSSTLAQAHGPIAADLRASDVHPFILKTCSETVT